MDLCHGEEAQPLEVRNWPALMIGTSCDAASARPPAQDISKTTSDPCVESSEHAVTAVLEVVEPAAHHSVDHRNDDPQRMAARSTCFASDLVFELLHALLAWRSFAQLEVISEKVEAAS